jgi:hypothetical protein
VAKQRRFVTLIGSGYRRERKGAPLLNSWRQYADAQAFVAVSLAHGERSSVVIDLSPLRATSTQAYLDACASCVALAAELGAQWDDCTVLTGAQRILQLAGALPADPAPAASSTRFVAPLDADDDIWREAAIWELPPVTVSFSLDERADAKALAEALAARFCGALKERAAAPKALKQRKLQPVGDDGD